MLAAAQPPFFLAQSSVLQYSAPASPLGGHISATSNSLTYRAVSDRYAESGRIGPLFIPMTALTVLLAVAMGWVLFQAEMHDMYWYVISPLVVAVPVAVSLWLAIRWGKCRNVLLAMVISVGMLLVYLGAYWQVGYQKLVVAHGPAAVTLVRQSTGLPGALGSFVLHARLTTPQSHPGKTSDPTRATEVSNYLFHGLEAVTLAILACGIGKAASRRVFYEDLGKWAKSLKLLFPPFHATQAAGAVDSEDWHALASLPRLSNDISNRANANGLWVEFEYVEPLGTNPPYITLSPTSTRARWTNGLLGGPKGGNRQRTLSPESGVRFAMAFPERFDIAGLAQRATQASAIRTPSNQPALVNEEVQTVIPIDDEKARALVLSEGPATYDQAAELRTIAIEATHGGDQKTVQRALRGRDVAIIFFLVFGLGSGVLFLNSNPPNNWSLKPRHIVPAAGFCVGMAGMFGALFLHGPISSWVLRRRFARRPASLVPAMKGLRPIRLRLSFARRFDLGAKGVDDVVLCAADPVRRCLLMEGLRHRYIVPAERIISLSPLQSDETLALELTLEAAGQTLPFVLWRENMKGTLQRQSILVSAGRDALRLCETLRKRLGLPSLLAK